MIKLPLTCKSSIIYEYEEETEDYDKYQQLIVHYYKFEIDYQVWAGEPMVMYYKDGSGYPGSDPECEIQSVKCLQIDDNKKLTAEENKKATDWFLGMIDIGSDLYDKVAEACFEDAASKYDDRY